MTEPLFVLVRPQMGENIGAAARAMWNFGLSRMAVVDPRDGWPNARATALASGAGRLLDGARICDETTQAVSEATLVLATTARRRDMTKPVLTPEQAMRRAVGEIAGGGRVAVLFGPERTGLENDDIVRANAVISVPVNPEFPSLNLAQCVLLCAYEWVRASGTGRVPDGLDADPAPQHEIEALTAHWDDRLSEAGFFFPPEKGASMRLTMRNLWSRMPLSRADVRILHGVMRQMVRWKDRDGAGAPAPQAQTEDLG